MLKINSSFKPRKISNNSFIKYVPFEQDADNCWLYAPMNNLFLNMGVLINKDMFIDYVTSMRINSKRANYPFIAGDLLCKFFNGNKVNAGRNGKSLTYYRLDVLAQPKLFGQLLLAGYTLIYTRYDSLEVLKDIIDNKILNKVIKKQGTRHASLIKYFDNKVQDYGSWGNNNPFNSFVFESVDLFMKCIRMNGISQYVEFIDFIQ